MPRVETILTTTQPNPAYGGIQLSREILEQLAEAVRTQSIPMMRNHDGRTQLRVSNVEAGVRERPDGEFEAWANFDVHDDDWAEFENELAESGGPGGMSFSMSQPFASLVRPGAPRIRITADAHHFSDEQLLAAGDAIAAVASVQVERLYQFSHLPPALVVVQYLADPTVQVSLNVLSNYLYDAIKGFFASDKPGPAIELRVLDNAEGREVSAHIPVGADEATAKRAMKSWETVAGQRGVWEYSDDDGWRALRGQEDQ
jgi:hypothetical protein